jgi:PAS domain S-box-containing protein
MSLRHKTIIIVGLAVISLIAVPYALLNGILRESVEKMEAENAEHEIGEIRDSIDDCIDSLDMFARDWSAWDDTCAFMEERNEQYIKSNLIPTVLADARLNVILYYDTAGTVVFESAVDWRKSAEVPFPKALHEYLAANPQLLAHDDVDSARKGLVLLPDGLMMLVTRPIVTSEGKGPIRGTLAMGRYFDDREITRISQRRDANITIRPLDDPQMPRDFKTALNALNAGAAAFSSPLDEHVIAAYTLLRDITGKPVAALKASMPRMMLKQSQASIADFVLYFLPSSLLFGAGAIFLLEKFVVSRLVRLTRSVSAVSASGDLALRVPSKGKDEVTRLSDEINKMLGSLERSSLALRAEKEFSESILNSAINIVLVCDYDGAVKYVNRYGLQLLGYEKQEVIGKNWLTTFLPKDIRDQKPQSLRNFYGGDVHSRIVENPVVRKNGERRLILWSSTRLKDGKGNVTGFMSFGNDITERKAAEESLARETMKLSVIVSSMEEGVVFIDKNDRIVEVNPFFSRLFGMPREELVGKSVWDLSADVIAVDVGNHISGFKTASVRSPIMLERRFGSIQVVLRIQPIYNEKGYNGVLLTVIDVTALVASRQEAESANVELEKKISELQQSRQAMLNMMQDMDQANRVLKDMQAQLIQQEKMSSIGTLAAGVAHEFNNILAGMMGFASLAQADPARVAKLADIVLREGDRAAKVIRSLLSFSKHREQSLAPVNLGVMIDDVLSLTRREFDKNNITVNTKYDPAPPVMADTGQIEQVFLNLFINARHAMERGGKLTISIWPENKEVLVAISDTGYGIPPENLAKIFDPFFSTKGVWGKDKQSGTGLGLSVSRNIIEAHGGRIDVSSAVGKGTTFTIHLPAAEGEQIVTHKPRTCRIRKNARQSYRILVADDEQVLGELLSEIISKMGHAVTVVSTGEAVLEELKKSSYDYLFLDMMMPGKYDGRYVLDKIEEMHLETRVFVCTGRVEDPDLAEILKKADGCIRKPFTADEIAAAINGEPVQDEPVAEGTGSEEVSK